MAITSTTDGAVSYEGRVLAIKHHTVRIMSDVWANERVAILSEEDGTTRPLSLGNDEFGYSFDAVVDAPPEVIAAWEAAVEAARLLREEQGLAHARERQARDYVGRVENGRNVVVARGRKIPRGTKGTVVVIRSGTYGMSALVRNGNEEFWISVNNLDNDHPLLKNGEPVEGQTWVSVRDAMVKEDDARRAALPKKGDEVFLKSNPEKKGLIFWMKGDRIGFKEAPMDEPTWANVSEVEIVPPTISIPSNVAKSLPAPFNRVYKIKPEGGKYAALDAHGRVIALLPNESAKILIDQVAAI